MKGKIADVKKRIALAKAVDLTPEIKPVPEGYFSTREFATERGISLDRARDALQRLVKEGKMVSVRGSAGAGGITNYFGFKED